MSGLERPLLKVTFELQPECQEGIMHAKKGREWFKQSIQSSARLE